MPTPKSGAMTAKPGPSKPTIRELHYGRGGFLDWLVDRTNPHYAFLLILPWTLFLLNPNWMFQGLGHMDPWYYFGMSLDFPRYQHLSPSYSNERLTWILP